MVEDVKKLIEKYDELKIENAMLRDLLWDIYKADKDWRMRGRLRAVFFGVGNDDD